MRHAESKLLLIPMTVLLLFGVHLSVASATLEHLPDGAHSEGHANTLTITAKHPDDPDDDDHYIFELSSHEIPSGWTNIDFHNESGSTHFGYIVRVDDEDADLTREQYLEEGSNLFQEAWDPYYAGDIDVEGMFDIMMPTLPEWFDGLVSSGGPGLLGGHQSSRTTINLAPGTYFIECYVLDTEGVFHITHGMVERLVVTEEESTANQPQSDLQVSISSTGGIVFDEENIQPGLTTFEVTFEDNIYYAHGLGHDVHLVRLDGDTSIGQINDWMDYLDVGADGYYADRGALVSSSAAPGPETFLGGVQSIFADEARGREYPQTAYFQAVLTPGRYALVAEVPNPMQPDPDNPEASMLVEFSVIPFAGLTGAWYDPATAGEGWNFVASPSGLFGYFYGYGGDGNPLWLITEEVISDIQAGEQVTFNLLHGEGGAFAAPVIPDNLQHWGEVTFTFENCNEATAEMSGADGTASHNLVRVAETAGLAGCGF